jgi:hypothetical protein
MERVAIAAAEVLDISNSGRFKRVTGMLLAQIQP